MHTPEPWRNVSSQRCTICPWWTATSNWCEWEARKVSLNVSDFFTEKFHSVTRIGREFNPDSNSLAISTSYKDLKEQKWSNAFLVEVHWECKVKKRVFSCNYFNWLLMLPKTRCNIIIRFPHISTPFYIITFRKNSNGLISF